MKRLVQYTGIALLALMVIGLSFTTSVSAKPQNSDLNFRPMVFVHGYTGSASQYEWQAMRFASNGYPKEYLNAFEYDSVRYRFFPAFHLEVYAALDDFIDAILLKTGADKIDLLGHSQGTTISLAYLNSSAARASKVAHYVNLDGRTASNLPGTAVGVPVPTLAIYGEYGMCVANYGEENCMITGAENEYVPRAPHNETCVSPVSFAYMYKFFTGNDPVSTDVLPEPKGLIELAGRALLYPQNIGVEGATLEIYEVDAETGFRKYKKPQEIYQIDETGNWGPFKAKPNAQYEFNIARETGNHHFYIEKRIRSDYFIRLNTSLPGQGLGNLMTRNPDQTNLVITRNREFVGDQIDGFNDVLAINGVNVVNEISGAVTRHVVALFLCDWYSDYTNDLINSIPGLTTTFLSGIDLYLRGETPPDATISIIDIPRGNCGTMHGINVPNWAIINEAESFTESISIILDDFIPDRCEETSGY